MEVIPQIKKAWKTKKIEDVSPEMFSILILGVFLWNYLKSSSYYCYKWSFSLVKWSYVVFNASIP
ncbi:PQ-loop repeat-containing protein [Salegentibacter lacus]|uniref:hypothetical protein n=1 Tax=Salegentibacter lacus TaxID=2873599 RepID=UPI001F46C613|nr:hypothetical protein [Salegentibacter lacus]